MAKMATVVFGILAVLLGVLFKGQNVAFMVGLAFAVACSANFPALLMSITEAIPGETSRMFDEVHSPSHSCLPECRCSQPLWRQHGAQGLIPRPHFGQTGGRSAVTSGPTGHCAAASSAQAPVLAPGPAVRRDAPCGRKAGRSSRGSPDHGEGKPGIPCGSCRCGSLSAHPLVVQSRVH